MMIKIIDWISRIIAVALASFLAIVSALCIRHTDLVCTTEPDTPLVVIAIEAIIIGIGSQVGLFLATLVRQKGARCKLVTAILMLIGIIGVISLVALVVIFEIIPNLFLYAGILLVCSVYTIQYSLLFKIEVGRLNFSIVNLFKQLSRLKV